MFSDEVALRASGQAGMFYGVQSLLQLLPPQIFAAKPEPGQGMAGALRLDRGSAALQGRAGVVRHGPPLLPKAEVKQLLDVLALHKVNMLQPKSKR